jgi:NAD(P)-dependent dehydrogenase (short-subunit alcohol dehydrogenase family)
MKGRRVLVIGGSSGIGREVALRLAVHGAQVAFHGRRRDKLEVAVTTPTVEFQDMILRAPGGPFMGDVSGFVSEMEATQRAVHGDDA